MLTVKAIYAPGHEEIFEVESTASIPIDGGPHVNLMMNRLNVGGQLCICSKDCLIFVMNDKGRTIANYGGF